MKKSPSVGLNYQGPKDQNPNNTNFLPQINNPGSNGSLTNLVRDPKILPNNISKLPPSNSNIGEKKESKMLVNFYDNMHISIINMCRNLI